MEIKNAPGSQQVEEMDKVYDVSRRRFFQLAGGIAGAGLLLSACRKRSSPTDTYLGSGDIALLNFFYVIQQLETAFYTQVVATPYYGLTVSESQMLTDVRDQEIAHSEYLNKLLGSNAVSNIVVNFSAITFADRTSTLTYAAMFEDMAISAFNGAAGLFSNPQYVYMLAKMASVEARHSACMRDLLGYGTFSTSPQVNSFGLDQAGTPASVFASAEAYLQTQFDSSKLPN